MPRLKIKGQPQSTKFDYLTEERDPAATVTQHLLTEDFNLDDDDGGKGHTH